MRRAVSVGAVLAGGQSSRMGRPKPMVELGGRPMLARIVGTVGSAGLEPVVVAKPDSELPHVDCRVLSEPDQPSHPLTGLVTALRASAGRGVVAIACDMPLVPAKFLSWLAALEEPLAVCEVGGRLEPLLGRYSPEVAERLAEGLERSAAMRDVVRSLEPYVVEESQIRRFGDPERIVFNVNTPEDLEAAEKLLRGRGGRFVRGLNRGLRTARR
jgi:molybdopterin-guanine dinucleotide biosynthesis protein A